jgi:hypothetical protein
MKTYGYIICLVLILLGALGGIDLYRTYTAQSDITGVIRFNPNQPKEALSIEVVTAFSHTGGNRYTYTNDYHSIEFDGQENEYTLTVNGFPVGNIEMGAGYISGEFTLSFYAVTGERITGVTLHVKLTFFATRTKLELELRNIDNGLSFFYSWMLDNGLTISLLEVV